jgi:glycine dehydrogenase subunit 1
MKYIPAGAEDRRQMLQEVGAASIEELFASIPGPLRLKGSLPLEPPLSDPDLEDLFGELAASNLAAAGPTFVGAGAYRHYRSAAVDAILGRAEFYTSYTPYQPEISQGTLQALFEYQTLVCQLTEMEVSNASLYDGGSALAEAVLMAARIRRGGSAAISEAVHPLHRRVAATYTRRTEPKLTSIPLRPDGTTDPGAVEGCVRAGAAAIVVQNPNFLGVVEPLEDLAQAARAAGALLIVSVAEPVSLGLLAGPGRFGADIAVGEGQPLGLPLSFGGPYLGFLACREAHVRAMPGRLVGETRDTEGRRGYVLTLATREQHIRRERATSNICTNQSLCALAACVQMAALGRRGLMRLAKLNAWRARDTLARLEALAGVRRAFAAPFFNEFVVDLPVEAEGLCRTLSRRGILAGVPLAGLGAGSTRQLLVCATELTRPADIETLAAAIEQETGSRVGSARGA